MTAEIGMRPYAFVLDASDLQAMANYFKSSLGFDLEWEGGADWLSLMRDGIRVMIRNRPGMSPLSEPDGLRYGGCWQVDDIDALHVELSQRGAIILHSPADQPWGVREMAIATPDAHHIMLVGPPKGGA